MNTRSPSQENRRTSARGVPGSPAQAAPVALEVLPKSVEAAVSGLLEANHLMAIGDNGPDGWPHVTTVGYLSEGLDLYFVTARSSRKLSCIQADCRVSVAVRGETQGPETVGVTLSGRAGEILHPAGIERVNRLIFSRFAGVQIYAPASASVAVIRIRPETVSAVRHIDGRSETRTYQVAHPAPATPYPGDGVSRLF